MSRPDLRTPSAAQDVAEFQEAEFREAEFRELVRAAGTRSVDGAERWVLDRHVPASAIVELADAGLFRRRWDGGATGGLAHLIVLSQELFRCDSGLALAAMAHSEAFIGALHRHARTDEQRSLLAAAFDGRAIGCFAATEAHGGSSLSDRLTVASRLPDGWRLTGTKRYVSNVGSASHAIVTARASDSADADDLSLFVLPLDLPGVSVDGFFDTAGVQACDVGQISFNVELPSGALLGSPGMGLLYASHMLQFERLAICAQLHSAAETALNLASAYARRRKLGGVRMMDKQVIRHRLAHGRAELWNLQSRLAALVEIAVTEGRMPGHEIAALKLTSGKAVSEIVDMCMQVFGARGNTSAYPLEKLLRDTRIARIGGGTDEVLADAVAGVLDRPDLEAEAALDRAASADLPNLGRRYAQDGPSRPAAARGSAPTL
ncbi:citronellyl-CoA dehydrogenase [Parafrankia irregularis]|uniref:Acyl-[acyl-carrier-protein] dehydrogenase MbtN n=1 Tax=Parafrankia irregularis TaxID=795642 RepID=A0A0S4QXM6_9ACTN|nr:MULTISPECIES: acyl-CoA dehydrogenase family protein [Parafrankia]MBE3205770.1 acyl-CoA/acyl-ACP dehydrogenase [Parafrankia sp. CH37]CUU59644.1 citronellyl-CoA dehydrogenase [Parafrankia irregularis]